MSCRIAKKKVESAIIYYLCTKFGVQGLSVSYSETKKNEVLRNELLSIGGIINSGNATIGFNMGKICDFDWVEVIYEE